MHEDHLEPDPWSLLIPVPASQASGGEPRAPRQCRAPPFPCAHPPHEVRTRVRDLCVCALCLCSKRNVFHLEEVPPPPSSSLQLAPACSSGLVSGHPAQSRCALISLSFCAGFPSDPSHQLRISDLPGPSPGRECSSSSLLFPSLPPSPPRVPGSALSLSSFRPAPLLLAQVQWVTRVRLPPQMPRGWNGEEARAWGSMPEPRAFPFGPCRLL